MLQKSSTLIGQLATVHICDWLTKVKQIYEYGMGLRGFFCFEMASDFRGVKCHQYDESGEGQWWIDNPVLSFSAIQD